MLKSRFDPRPGGSQQRAQVKGVVCLVSCIGLLFLGVATAGASQSAGAEQRGKPCGQVSAAYPDVEDGSGLELVDVRGISCRRARHVARECIRRYHVPGWSAHYDRNLLGHLRRGRQHILVKGIAGGGPHCIPDPFSRSGGDLARRPYRSCGLVGSSVGGGYGDIRAYGLTCAAARRVIRSSLRGESHGWKFIYGAGRDEYRKGAKRITGVPLGDRPASARSPHCDHDRPPVPQLPAQASPRRRRCAVDPLDAAKRSRLELSQSSDGRRVCSGRPESSVPGECDRRPGALS